MGRYFTLIIVAAVLLVLNIVTMKSNFDRLTAVENFCRLSIATAINR